MDIHVILGSMEVIFGPLIGFGLIKFLNLDGFAAGVLVNHVYRLF